jgi:hypothetical protein
MKKLIIITLILLLYLPGFSAPWLGYRRAELINKINKDPTFTYYGDLVTTDGTGYIIAHTKYDDVCKWFFIDGVVSQYQMTINSDDINGFVSYFNRNLFKDGFWEWSDYPGGAHWYYHILKRSEKYHVIIVSYIDIEITYKEEK